MLLEIPNGYPLRLGGEVGCGNVFVIRMWHKGLKIDAY